MPSDSPFGRVTILGLGLMGGSLARAASALSLSSRITGWSPKSTERDAALTTGAVHFAAAAWQDAVADADLVVLAVPLNATCQLVSELTDWMPANAVVTDVASLKRPVEDAAREAGLLHRWVGSHPMAGAESSGFWASRDALFQGARVWMTGEAADNAHLQMVRRLWTGVGATPHDIGAREHDRLMAWVSHLPQVTANLLADALDRGGIDVSQLGPGGRDMTRLAASSPAMWRDLLAVSGKELAPALRDLGRSAIRLAQELEEGDAESGSSLMHRTRSWRGRA